MIAYELGFSQSAELGYRLESQSPMDAGAVGFFTDSSLKLWLDASDTLTITHSTGDVTAWRDKSGNGNNATTSVGFPRTGDSTRNGKNVIDFTSDQMTLPAALYTIPNGANTLFVVSKRTSETGLITTTVSMSTGATNQFFHIYSDVSGAQSFINRSTASPVASATGIINTEYNTAFMRRSGTNQEIAVNTINAVDSASATNITPTAAQIGTAAGGLLPFIGSIAEIILYDSALTDAQALTVMQYLSRKWNTPLYLPVVSSSLQLWLDGSDATSIINSVGAVSSWRDKSGNGNNATQATGASQPTLTSNRINGKSALVFDGTDDFLTAPTSLMNSCSNTSITVFIVSITSVIKAADIIALSPYLANPTFSVLLPFSNSIVYFDYANNSTGRLTVSWGGTVGTPYLWTLDSNSTIQKNIYRNGVQIATSANATVANFGTTYSLNIGASAAGTNHFNGSIGEILIYNRFLTDAEKASVNAYLMNKWGIA